MSEDSEMDFTPLPIDGILDLHTFRPQDIGELIPDYIEECRKAGIYSIRIIHGKGMGNLRRSVHAILERHPDVLGFSTATDASSWGATLVELRQDDA